MEVAPSEPQQSRVNQMLQHTRDAVAANDTRVALSNAIIEGDAETADAIQDGKLMATADGLVSTDARLSADADAQSLLKNAMGVLESNPQSVRADPAAPDRLVPNASNPNGKSLAVETFISSDEDHPQTVTVVRDSNFSHSRFRHIDYQLGPPPSPNFTNGCDLCASKT